MVEIIFCRNCVYQFAYHAVWCPKYGHQILIGQIVCAASEMIDQICKHRQWPIIAKEIQPDHIHLFLTIPTSVSVASPIKILKRTTARKLFLQFPQLKNQLWGGHLWSPSYYAGTAGNVSAKDNKKYIDRVEHIGGRR